MPARPTKERAGAWFQRGVRVLVCVAEAAEIRTEQISQDVGLPLSTV